MFCNQDPNLELSLRRRIFIFLVGAFESMLFGGAIFGWPQLVHVLKVEGIYSDLCGPTTLPPQPALGFHHETVSNVSIHRSPITLFSNVSLGYVHNTTFQISSSQRIGVEKCDPQDDRFALIFTLTVACYSIPGVLVGYLLHIAGLRVTRISGGTMLAMGFLFLGMATKESPYWLFPAMILMAFGGNQIRMSVMQFGDLFPGHRATAITMLSGMYAASAALFLIFQYTAALDIDRSKVCWVLAGISLLTVFFSFFMPVHHIPVTEDRVSVLKEPSRSKLPLSKSLCSGSSWLHLFWLFVSLFAVNNFQQSYNVWVSASSSSVSEAGYYSVLFSYSNLVTIFFGPMGGAFTDYMIRRGNRASSELDRRVKEVQASFLPLLVTTISTSVMYSCIMFFHPAAIYVSLMGMVVARPCIIAVSTAYLRLRFPADHFNRLLGIYGTTTSVLLFLQYAHFRWAMHMYYAAHACVLAFIAFSYLNPIHLLFTPLMRHAVAIRDQLSENELGAMIS